MSFKARWPGQYGTVMMPSDGRLAYADNPIMISRLKAQYRGKVFVPAQACDLPEGAEVELTITRANVDPSSVLADEERGRVLARVVERMRNNPIPADAPVRFTREELHERI